MDEGSSLRDKDMCDACSLAATLDALEDLPPLPDLAVLLLSSSLTRKQPILNYRLRTSSLLEV